MNEDQMVLWGGSGLIVAIVIGLIALMVTDYRQWQAFKVTHDCKVVAHISGEVFPTYGFSGNGQFTVGVGSTSSKTGWLCDDGITYYR